MAELEEQLVDGVEGQAERWSGGDKGVTQAKVFLASTQRCRQQLTAQLTRLRQVTMRQVQPQ